MKLIITNYNFAEQLLSNPEKYPGINHIVSIGSDNKLPKGYNSYPAENKIRLEFFDISVGAREGMNGPSKDDLNKLIQFYAKSLVKSNLSFLIHCFAGISRSTAAGLILLTMFYKNWEKAREELYKLVPHASPNVRMIKLANEVFYDEWKK